MLQAGVVCVGDRTIVIGKCVGIDPIWIVQRTKPKQPSVTQARVDPGKMAKVRREKLFDGPMATNNYAAQWKARKGRVRVKWQPT